MALRAAEALGRRARPQDPRNEDLLALSQGDRGQAAQRARQAGSVGYPEPDPEDQHVFGPPGSKSGSINQRYGSGSFYHQAKIVRKTFIPAVL